MAPPPLASIRCAEPRWCRGVRYLKGATWCLYRELRTTHHVFSLSPKQLHHIPGLWPSFPLLDPTALRLHLSLSLFYPVRTVLLRAQKSVIRPALSTFASLNCILSHPGKLPEPPFQPLSSTCLGRLFRTLWSCTLNVFSVMRCDRNASIHGWLI